MTRRRMIHDSDNFRNLVTESEQRTIDLLKVEHGLEALYYNGTHWMVTFVAGGTEYKYGTLQKLRAQLRKRK